MLGHETQSGLSPQNESRVLPGLGILLARSVFYVITASVIALGVWTTFTKVDIVVSAGGSLVVEGEPLRVTVEEQGMVLRVAVKVGQHVRKGETILELDPFRHSSDIKAMQNELEALRTEKKGYDETASRLEKAAALTEKGLELAGESEAIVARQSETFRKLAEENVFSSLEAQQKQRELLEARANIIRLKEALNSKETELARNRMLSSEKTSRIDAIEVKIKHLTEARQRTVLKAPADGTVTALAMKHAGSVLRPDSPAAVILPDNVPLRARVKIQNASMRRLKHGMPVRIRFDAFPHQDYGFMLGHLLRIEPDADKDGSYAAWIALDDEKINGPYGVERLRPGLNVQADIIVDQKRLLDLALAPFKKLGTPITVTE